MLTSLDVIQATIVVPIKHSITPSHALTLVHSL